MTTTIHDFKAKVLDIIASQPEFRYNNGKRAGNCSYLPDDINPQGCVMGAAAAALDFGADLEQWEGDTIDHVFGPDGEDTWKLGDLVYDSLEDWHVVEWLSRVQAYQDRGVAWGDAAKLADENPDILDIADLIKLGYIE